jgi:four helix bundle protein
MANSQWKMAHWARIRQLTAPSHETYVQGSKFEVQSSKFVRGWMLSPPYRQSTNQTRRAAVSIPSNLAEGCSRSSKADYARLVEIATGSVFEVVSQAAIGRNQGFLNPELLT